jgi:hypothetical protein
MKMKVKIDEIEDRCRQQLQSVFEEAEEKLIAGQAKNTNAVASLQGITDKQSSVVQYLQATLERTVSPFILESFYQHRFLSFPWGMLHTDSSTYVDRARVPPNWKGSFSKATK